MYTLASVLTSTHNLCFGAKIKNKKMRYTSAYPSFAIIKVGLRGYILHANVILIKMVKKKMDILSLFWLFYKVMGV